MLTIDLEAQGSSTLVKWRQTFDTAEHYVRVRPVVSVANEQNLDRLASRSSARPATLIEATDITWS